MASEIVGVIPPGSDSRKVYFNCRGIDGYPNENVVLDNPGPSGENTTIIYEPVVEGYQVSGNFGVEAGLAPYGQTGGGKWKREGRQLGPGPGGPGGAGGAGNSGSAGGNMYVVGELKLEDDKEKGILIVDVRGGSPSKGQPGGAGGPPGTIHYVNDEIWFSDRTNTSWEVEAMPVLVGGGGQGCGGKGGDTPASGFGPDGSFYASNDTLSSSATSGLLFEIPSEVRTVEGGPGGPGNPPGSRGQSATQQPSKPRKPNFAKGTLYDPVHLLMIIQRLTAQYEMLIASSGSTKLLEGSFAASLAYINNAVSEIKKATDSPATDEKQHLLDSLESALRHLSEQMINATDAYGNAFNCVPNPTISISTMERELAALKSAENHRDQMAARLADRSSDQATMRSTFSSDKDEELQLQWSMDALTGEEGTVGSLASKLKEVRVADSELLAKTTKLQSNLNRVWDQAKLQFPPNCVGWQEVLGAVGNALMFTQPEIGMLYKLGSLASIGSSLGDVHLEGHQVEKKYVTKAVYSIEQDLEGDSMKHETERSNDSRISLRAQDSDFLALIAASRASFLALCEKYFTEITIPEIRAANNEFSLLLQQAQLRNNAIVECNRMILQYEQASLDLKTLRKKNELLKTLNASLTDGQTDLMYTYYSRAVRWQTSHALETLYNAVRAYNCASLRPSEVFNALSSLLSYENIDQNALEIAFYGAPGGKPGLVQELQAFVDSRLAASSKQSGRNFHVDEFHDPAKFKLFKETGKMKIFPSFETKLQYGMDKSWVDIRLCHLRVYLVGAKGLYPKDLRKPLAEREERTSIDVNISFGDTFSVWDYNKSTKAFTESWFEMKRPPLTFSYRYRKAGSTNFADDYTPTTEQSDYMTSFKFASRGDPAATEYMIPLGSPFCEMTISVDNSVDLTGLTRVEFSMDVYARNADVRYEEDQDTPPSPVLLGAKDHAASIVEPQLRHGTIHSGALSMMSHDIASKPVNVPIELFAFKPTIRLFSAKFRTTSLSDAGFAGGRNNNMTLNRALWTPNESIFPKGNIVIPIKEIQSSCAPLGNTTDEQARRMASNSDKLLSRSIYSTVLQQVNGYIDNHVVGGDRADIAFGGSSVDQFGHFAAAGGVLKLGDKDAKSLVSLEEGPYAVFRAFPNSNQVILSPYHSANFSNLKTTTERRGYIWDNFKQIRSDEEAMIKSKASTESCFVLLFSGGVIGHKVVHFWTEGTKTNLAIEAVTSSWHAVDGDAVWIGQHDSTRPGEYLQLNLHLGQHPFRDIDFVNVGPLPCLLGVIRKSLIHSLESIRTGQLIDSIIASKNRNLSTQRSWFNSMDSATVFAAKFREYAGANIAWDRPRDASGSDLSLRSLQDPNLPVLGVGQQPGLYVDGVPCRVFDEVTMQNSGPAGSSTISEYTEKQKEEAIKAVERITRYERSSNDVDGLRDQVKILTEQYMQREIDAAATKKETLSTKEILSRLKQSEDFRTKIDGLIRSTLIDDLAKAAIHDSLSLLPAFSNPNGDGTAAITEDQLIALINDTVEIHTVWNLKQPDGLIDIWMTSKVESAQLDKLRTTPVDLEEIIRMSTSNAVNLNKAASQIREKIATIRETDPGLVEERKKLQNIEDQIEKENKERENAEELQDLRKNEEIRAREHQDDEKKERKHLFEMPSNDHGRGAHGGEHAMIHLFRRNRPYNLVA